VEQNENRIRISLNDLESVEVTKRVTEMTDAQKIALVRPIGDPTRNDNNSAGLKAILLLSLAGLAGGFIAFALIKVVLFGVLASNSENSATFSNLGFSFILAFAIGLTVSLIDAASTRIGSKIASAAAIAIPTALTLGLAIGAIANFYYSNAMQDLVSKAYEKIGAGESTESVSRWLTSSTHFPRGLAWLICGLAAGMTVGIASRSLKRTGLTAGGGALGGFLGGFVFDFIPQDLEWLAQMAGICITGLLIGSSMALLEQVARTQWIEIVAGGMAGKQFILYKTDISIGSSSSADITLIKDSAIAPLHARIYSQGGRTVLESLNPGLPCSVDGTVDMRFYLVDTSTITLGSTQIRFREKKSQKNPSQGVGRLS
jgi:MFS family permease